MGSNLLRTRQDPENKDEALVQKTEDVSLWVLLEYNMGINNVSKP